VCYSVFKYVCIYTHTYVYTYIHTYVYTYIHTYIHTYVQYIDCNDMVGSCPGVLPMLIQDIAHYVTAE